MSDIIIYAFLFFFVFLLNRSLPNWETGNITRKSQLHWAKKQKKK